MAAITRRCLLQTAAAAATALPPVARFAYAAEAGLHVACNQFCWTNMYGRKKKDFNANLDAGLAEVRRSGVDGLEPTLGSPAAAEEIIPLLKKHSLAMRSCYAGGTLHAGRHVGLPGQPTDQALGQHAIVVGQGLPIGAQHRRERRRRRHAGGGHGRGDRRCVLRDGTARDRAERGRALGLSGPFRCGA